MIVYHDTSPTNDSLSRYLAHQWILGQRSRPQGHKVQKGDQVAMSLYILQLY